MDANEMAKWLAVGGKNGASDEEFAEFFVMLFLNWKDRNMDMQPTSLTKSDMMEFDTAEFTEWLKTNLDEIIFSEEVDSSAWWKKPPAIRAYARIKFKEPIPKSGRVWTWESFRINVRDEKINIDFKDKEIFVDPDDRCIVTVIWKNPDEDFQEGFDKLSINVLKNESEKISLNDDLTSVVCASRTAWDEEDTIEIDKILCMTLNSPDNEFQDISIA